MTISTLSLILAQEDKGGGGLISLLILILPMAALVYLMTIPQRKQRQKQEAMLRQIDVGNEVVTTGGIVGVVTYVDDDLFHVEIDDDVVVRVAKGAISKNLSVVEEPAPSRSRKGLLDGALGGSKVADDADDAASDDATDGGKDA